MYYLYYQYITDNNLIVYKLHYKCIYSNFKYFIQYIFNNIHIKIYMYLH